MTQTTRRTFLKSSVCMVCVIATSCGKEPPGPIDAGNVDDYASGVLTYIGGGVAVGEDDLGLYAISTICTHSNCDIGEDGTLTQDLISCSCHGSQFAKDGSVITGPAQSALDFYEITLGDFGAVTVHTDRGTDPSTRVSPEE